VHYGTVTRSVRDSAVFLDAVADHPAGAEPYAAAAGRPPGRLRIAVSTKVPPPLMARLSAEQRGALDKTAALLRSLGHEVVERDPAYEPAVLLRGLTRYFAGIADDAAKLPPERLERRTRAMARIGRATPRGQLAASKAEERAFAERIGRLWDDVDVVLTPVLASLPWPVGAMEGRGALWTFNAAGSFVPWPGVWNITGQPAASVPAGFTPDGVPLAVQLVGRRDDEPTLLALAAQIEAERPWAQHRPPRFA